MQFSFSLFWGFSAFCCFAFCFYLFVCLCLWSFYCPVSISNTGRTNLVACTLSTQTCDSRAAQKKSRDLPRKPSSLLLTKCTQISNFIFLLDSAQSRTIRGPTVGYCCYSGCCFAAKKFVYPEPLTRKTFIGGWESDGSGIAMDEMRKAFDSGSRSAPEMSDAEELYGGHSMQYVQVRFVGLGASVSVDEAHCCDTSRSLRILIGQHSQGRATPSAFAFAARQCDWFTLVNSYVVATPDAFFTLFCGIAKMRCSTATRSVWPGLKGDIL